MDGVVKLEKMSQEQIATVLAKAQPGNRLNINHGDGVIASEIIAFVGEKIGNEREITEVHLSSHIGNILIKRNGERGIWYCDIPGIYVKDDAVLSVSIFG